MGKIIKVTEETVTVQFENGKTRSFSLETVKYSDPKVGDKVTIVKDKDGFPEIDLEEFYDTTDSKSNPGPSKDHPSDSGNEDSFARFMKGIPGLRSSDHMKKIAAAIYYCFWILIGIVSLSVGSWGVFAYALFFFSPAVLLNDEIRQKIPLLNKHKPVYTAAVYGVVFAILLAVTMLSDDESDTTVAAVTPSPTPVPAVQPTTAPSETPLPSVSASPAPTPITPSPVYVGRLMRFPDQYSGKEENVYIDNPVAADGTIEVVPSWEHEIPFAASLNDEEQLQFGDSEPKGILLNGTVQYDDANDIVYLDNPEIVRIDETSADPDMSELKSSYKKLSETLEHQDEKSFKASAESVTWDELRRYPDTYEGKPIKLTLYMKTVDPDGILFDGDKIGVIPGTNNEVAVTDGRDSKEPRILEGDTVTFYGVGNGTAVIKVQDRSGLIPKTVDKYEIPSVIIRYNNEDTPYTGTVEQSSDSSTSSNYDEDDYTKRGEEAAEKINAWIEEKDKEITGQQ